MTITTELVRANAKGKHRWIAFHDPLLPQVPAGIERTRLGKLCGQLTARKVRDVRWHLDEYRRRLCVSWVRHDGGEGRINLNLRKIPKMADGRTVWAYRWWSEKPHT